LLGGLGLLFRNPARLYVYPSLDPNTGKTITAGTFQARDHLKHLYAHLLENRFIQDVQQHDRDLLPISSREVLKQIQSGDAAWQKNVPPVIVDLIKQESLFGCIKSSG
jgi:hypothetical protein